MINLQFQFFFIILLQLLSSCKNNDELYLKELKQQNKFLEEQYENAKLALEAKTQSHPDAKVYNDVFEKQSAILENLIDSLKLFNEKELQSRFQLFVKQHNIFFNEVQKEPATKLLLDDAKLVLITNDTVPTFSNNEIVKEITKQRLLSHYVLVGQLLRNGTYSYFNGWHQIDRWGYRLTILKDSICQFNLKFKGFNRAPYFKQLQFVSLCKIKKVEYAYDDKYSNISKWVVENYNKEGVLIIKTKPLEKGFYRINCNKISITEIGRLEKVETYFDFEID